MAIFPFNLWGGDSEPDFDYPQTVAENASKDLKAALKTSDGQKAIDAIIRYSIAKGLISDENMPDIIKNIEDVIAKEKRPQFKSLLYYFEALAFKSYSENFTRYDRDNADDETPADDYSEWDEQQFEAKVDELITLALAPAQELQQVHITSLNKIITCDKMGATYVPNLFDFLSMKCRRLTDTPALRKSISNNWMEAEKNNVPAYLFAVMTCDLYPNKKELYEKYKDNEHSGMILENARYDSDYTMLKDYIRRFPTSFYAPDIRNNINSIEQKRVNINYPDHAHSTDLITVQTSLENVKTYKLNLYRIPDKIINSKSQKYDIESSELQLVESKTLTNNKVIPFSHHDTITFGPLKYGMYIILPQFDSSEGNVMNKNFDISNAVTVHDLTMFTVEKGKNQCAVYVVDSKTGQPVEGATVRYSLYEDKTDKQGCFVLPEKIENCDITVKKGGDTYGPGMHYSNHYYNESRGISLTSFTDLSIYRPGETVKFSAILYNTSAETENHKVIPDESIRAIFSDANGDELDTLNLVTDQFGRIQGEFKIPTGRLNGEFRITFYKKGYGNFRSHYVNVSEYKTPTFDITFNNDRYVFTADQPIVISGKVTTYSGMPVANAEVRLKLSKESWDWGWWRKRYGKSNDHIADTLVVTNEKGEFSYTFDDKLFEEKKDRYCHNIYNLNAICTNSTGESQENSTSFIVGSNRDIQFTKYDFDFINTEPLKLPIILNTTDENEKSAVCIYQVTPVDDENNILKTGSLSTDNPIVDLTSLPSGTYKIGVRLAEEKSTYFTKTKITLYKPTDKQAPIDDCPIWIPTTGRKVDAKNVAHITIGTSAPESHIYYIASSRNKVRSEGWVTYKPGIHDFTVQIPNEPEEYITVEFFNVYKGQVFNKSVRMISETNKEQLKVKVVSFRNKLVPGTHEKWTFQLVDKKGNPRNGAMIFEMFDKALNTLSDNSWYFHPSLRSLTSYYLNNASLSGYNYIYTNWSKKNERTGDFDLPELNTYDMDIFSFHNGIVALGSAAGGRYLAKSARMLEDNYATAEMAPMMEEAGVLEDGVASEEEAKVNNENLDKVQMRENDVKTALWMPNLVADANGNVTVEFEAPNFNTTWLVQAIAYSSDLYADKLDLEMLTQKPLMVKASLPRFLRQGDVATLAAQVQNATDKATKCDAVIELFDPRTGDVIASRNFNETLQPMGTNPVTIDWTVPQDMPFVGFRIKAANEVYGDGEQVMLPILESISPVIETKPFFINPGDPTFNFKMPVFPNDARVTLEYCDNPVWYCVTALPTIFNNNYGISTSLAHSLYAITLAQGVAKSQPQIKEAITYWKQHNEDSTLVSMLAKNGDLKIGTLLASPWLQEADRQTLRMSKLDELFDEVKMKAEHDRIVESLRDLQMPDGGWTWYRYPQCKSSLWATETILEIIGELNHLGYLTDDDAINDMVKRAMVYYDKEYIEILKDRQKYAKNDYTGFSSYVYVRTFFKNLPLSKDNADLMKKALKAMKKEWKGLSLGQKAFFAMALNRNDDQKTAKDIMESIRQFSIVKPELGMYWDNLQNGGWYFNDKVAVTSTIIQAFHEIDPRQDEIDLIRKWILLMKQSNDWGSSSLAADAVYSLLATGSQWLSRNEMPAITLNGQQLEFDKVAQYLGYCRTQIPAISNAELNIDRNGNNPAWGAVYCQYKAPMDQVKEYSITELSITKEFYVYAQDGTLHTANELKVGDKVQVRTVIKNNKDLDYVTVTDERGACFEPVDQKSGYRYQDRSYLYLETKDASTNIFFDDLRKGTHVITYDVFVTAPGQYNVGIATAQCQYAPQISAHSTGRVITIKP